MHKTIQSLLHKNKISIDREELKLQIKSHPSYPSLHAITGVLDHFGIENMALDIPQNEEIYKQLPKYFIAQLKNEEGEHILFVDKSDITVKLNYADNKKEKINKTEFLKQWTGIVVVVDEEELNILNKPSLSKYVNYFPIILLVSVLGFILFNNVIFSLFNVSHFILSAIGIYVSVLLIKHELGINSDTVEKLCNQTEKTSCNAILNSKGANFFGLFKLSDVSFVYFVSLTVAWLLFYMTATTIVFTTMIYASLFSVPVIVYSVYYQAVVVKKWCPLCLVTACVLLCQSLLAYFLNSFNFTFELDGFLILAISLLSITVLYANIKPILSSKLSLDKTKIEYLKFKRKFSLFNSLYSNNNYLETNIANLEEIIFGNKNAKTEIVVITNPMCGFCKATHQAVDKLLKNTTNDIKIVIRFNINTQNKEDTSYKIATALLNLYQKDVIACREAMHQIYTDGVDVNNWLTRYKSYTVNSQLNIFDIEKQWCLDNNINFTPAVYLNNREYPKEYDLSDLNFFMEDLESHLPSSQRDESEKQYEKEKVT